MVAGFGNSLVASPAAVSAEPGWRLAPSTGETGASISTIGAGGAIDSAMTRAHAPQTTRRAGSNPRCGLEETRETAQRELEALDNRREKIEELEHDRDALLESYVSLVPEVLDALTPEERHRIYKMLRLRVILRPDAPLEVSGLFSDGLSVSKLETASKPRTP